MNLPHDAPNDFFAEAYSGNKCVLAGTQYLDLGEGCTTDASRLVNKIILGNNTVYAPGDVTVNCGKTYTFAQWAALGLDKGSSVLPLPTTDTIIGWARQTLQM